MKCNGQPPRGYSTGHKRNALRDIICLNRKENTWLNGKLINASGQEDRYGMNKAHYFG